MIELVKYRDWGMNTYTYFWINSDKRIISPYFDDDEAAKKWAKENGYGNV